MEDADLTRQVRRSFERYSFQRSAAAVSKGGRRTSVVRRSVALGATAVAVVALLVLNATSFVGAPQAAFAGWAPAPSVADRALAAAAESACLANAGLPAMSLVAQDQRGNAAALVYAAGSELAICLVLKDTKGDIVTAASGVSHLEGPAGTLRVDTALAMPRSANSEGLRIVAGRVSPAAKAVNVERTSGPTVVATVASGYFVAWWPSDADATVVTAADAGGAPIATSPALR